MRCDDRHTLHWCVAGGCDSGDSLVTPRGGCLHCPMAEGGVGQKAWCVLVPASKGTACDCGAVWLSGWQHLWGWRVHRQQRVTVGACCLAGCSSCLSWGRCYVRLLKQGVLLLPLLLGPLTALGPPSSSINRGMCRSPPQGSCLCRASSLGRLPVCLFGVPLPPCPPTSVVHHCAHMVLGGCKGGGGGRHLCRRVPGCTITDWLLQAVQAEWLCMQLQVKMVCGRVVGGDTAPAPAVHLGQDTGR